MLAFLAAGDVEALAADPPAGLRWAGSRPLPTSPDDVIAVFEPSR